MRFTLISAKSATSLNWDFRACSWSASAQCQRRFVLTAPNTVQPNDSKLYNFTAFNFTGKKGAMGSFVFWRQKESFLMEEINHNGQLDDDKNELLLLFLFLTFSYHEEKHNKPQEITHN